jgi:hypothetical protein
MDVIAGMGEIQCSLNAGRAAADDKNARFHGS